MRIPMLIRRSASRQAFPRSAWEREKIPSSQGIPRNACQDAERPAKERA